MVLASSFPSDAALQSDHEYLLSQVSTHRDISLKLEQPTNFADSTTLQVSRLMRTQGSRSNSTCTDMTLDGARMEDYNKQNKRT